ncbi:MAG: sugar-binding protein [Cytophagaceae bacterium]
MKTHFTKWCIGFLLSLGVVFGSIAQVPLVYDVENTGSSCVAPPLPAVSQLQSYSLLPDPFAWSNGSGRVNCFSDWKCRRNEIKQEIERYEIGVKPPKPSNVTATYSGGVLTVNVTENGNTLTLTSRVTMPTGTGPFPVVIGMNAPTGQLPANLFNGVIQIPFNHDQVAKYTQGDRDPSYPFFKLYPNLVNNGYYSAWAWGVSRLIDGIEIVRTQLNADTKRIAVTGCSYAGKMALFAGAFDERVALTIAQESGGGGVNSWRVSETIGNVEKIDNTNYAWFMQSMKTNFQGQVGKLPHDHHELMAMIAPRALLVLGNPPFEWLGDESGYVSCRAAQEVWKTMGVSDRFGFSFRGGHNHCSLPTESNPEVTAFVDKFLRNSTTANTNIQVHSFNSTDYTRWKDAWDNYTFSNCNPNTPTITFTTPTATGNYFSGADLPITVSVTDADNNVVKVEYFNGNTKIGESTTSPYSFTWLNIPSGSVTLRAVVTDASNNTSSASIVINIKDPPFNIYKVTTPPVIDGTVDALWNNASIPTISASKLIVGTVSNAADLSGTAKIVWDNTYVYVLAQVIDDTRINDSQNSYEDDAVEFYFDIGNDKATAYAANDVQYTFGWNDGTVVGSLPSGRSVTGITYSVVNTTNGYIVEGRIPWSTLQGTPAVGQYHGIEFMINDDDDGTGRDAKRSWSSATDDAWQNPSLFGTGILMDVIACTPPTTPTITGASSMCSGSTITLTTISTSNLQWYNGATQISGATGTTLSVTTAGDYTVVATGSDGCTATSAIKAVTVNALPTATITASGATTFCQGGSVTLNANTGTGLTYQWKNGTTAVGASSSSLAIYLSSGSYTVEVTNVNNCIAVSSPVVVTVNPAPTATISTTTPTTFCQGGSVVLTANSGTGLTYQWRNGTSNIASATSATYTANSSGNYNVIVNSGNCSATSTSTTVTVNTLPTATVTAGGATTFCQGGSVVLSANTGTGLTYQWRNGTTNIATATSATYTANSSGNYNVIVTSGNCSATSTSTTVTVNTLPTATVTTTTPTTFCQGGSVVLSANTGTGLTYQWRNGTSNIASATGASYTATTVGSYNVIVSSGNCSATSTSTTVTVSAPITVSITPSGIQTLLPSQPITLTASTSATGVTYTWYNGTSVVGSNASTLSVTTAGNYSVQITNGSCQATSNTVSVVNANAPLVSMISPTNNGTAVAPATIILEAQATDSDGSITKVEFYQNNVKVGEGTGTTSYQYTLTNVAQGSYTFYAVATDNSGLQTTSASVNFTVGANQSPTVNTFTATYNQPTPGSSSTGSIDINVNAQDPEGGALTVEIYDGTTLLTTLTSAPYTYTYNNPSVGTHDIVVKVKDSEGNTVTQTQSVTVIPASTPTRSANSLQVTYYPNPYREVITIEGEGSMDYIVQDMRGHEVERGTINTIGQVGANLPAAQYIVILQNQDKRSVIKIEKQ